MAADPKKVQETKRRLRDAFFSIYKEKRIDKIGIREITDKAGFNRGTFYIHYRDIYDLLEQTEDELIRVLSLFADNIMSAVFHGGDIQNAMPPKAFFDQYGTYMKVLVGPNGDPSFVERLRKFIKELFFREAKDQITDMKQAEYVFEYISSAQLGLLTYWFQKDMEMPAPQLAKMIQTLMTYGPMKLLSAKPEPV